jgi:small subunit ribosomal protein S4
VRVGEKIAVRPESRRLTYFKNIIDSGELNRRNVPDWLRLNAADVSGEIVTLPRREDAEQGINEQLIVEYYSRRKP